MGSGCCGGVAKCSDAQRNEMFTVGVKEMLKMCLVDGYLNREQIAVLAPGEAMEKLRAFAEKVNKASEVARDTCEDAMEGATDKANELADKAKEAAGSGGMFGKLAGSAIAGATDLAGKAANAAASGAGLAAEKALQLLYTALKAAIDAIDQPFKDVGKDIFRIKEKEIITCYLKVIEDCRINDAVKCVRGSAPYGADEYKACKPSACCDLLQSVCEKEIIAGLRGVVQEEINKHAGTKAWDLAIEKYNECNAKLKEYSFLKDYVGEPFKLDINEYIIESCAGEFHRLMCEREAEIRKAPEGKSKEMPRMFHHLFGGDPDYNGFTMEHYANFRKK